MNDELKRRALKFLHERARTVIEDEEITIEEAAEALNLSRRAAHIRMSDLVKEGIYTTRMAYVPEKQRAMRVWKLKEQKA